MRVRLVLGVLTALAAGALATQAAAEVKTVRVTVRPNSEAPGYEGYPAMDGNPDTMCHTDFQLEEPALRVRGRPRGDSP